jgi:hypothetical protein
MVGLYILIREKNSEAEFAETLGIPNLTLEHSRPKSYTLYLTIKSDEK